MSLIPYAFDNQPVRTITRDGEPWFVLADVCRVLEITNPRDAAGRLDDDEKNTVAITDGTPGNPNMTTVNESGLYSLTLTSRKPEAKRFRKWITSEVIPSIRKTGSYGASDPMVALSDPATMRALLLGYTEKVIALEGRVSELQPKAVALDRIANTDGSLCLMDTAKTLQVRPKDLIAWMKAHLWIFMRVGTSHWVGRAEKLNAGWLEHKVTTIHRTDGTERITTQVRVTPKGLAKLAEAFPVQGEIVP